MRPQRYSAAGPRGTFCARFLYTSGLIAANPMPLVGRPKLAKTLPKALSPGCVGALLGVLDGELEPRRRRNRIERDRAHPDVAARRAARR
jgi:site-specific recombinase XerD